MSNKSKGTKKVDAALHDLGLDPETLLPKELSKQSDKNSDWHSKLLQTDKKQPKSVVANALIALREAPEWQGVLGYDEFSLQILMRKQAPWVQDDRWKADQPWTDTDDVRTAEWLQHQGIGITKNVAGDAAETVAMENKSHPIRDYIRPLQWDGTPRIETFASVYLGAEPSAYTTAVCKVLFLGAIARLRWPGCQHDHMVILEGEQGTLKSSALRMLFSPWFSDDIAELGSKDSSMQVRVAWGIEIAELASMERAETERIKAFITRRVDIYRPSYGRRVISAPRQSVLIGTTNSSDYLKDETGGRRYLPIKCGRIDLAAIKRDKDQIWAEALRLVVAGHKWWLTDKAVIKAAREEQANRFAADSWFDSIAVFVSTKTDVSVGEVLRDGIGVEQSKWTRSDQTRVGSCLTAMRWRKYRKRIGKQLQWRYSKSAEGEEAET
jgi:predicted P-loop ATPase